MNFHRLDVASCWAPYLAPESHFAKWKNKDLETKQADFKKSCIYRVPYYGCHLNVAKTHFSFLFMYSFFWTFHISIYRHFKSPAHPISKMDPCLKNGYRGKRQGPLKVLCSHGHGHKIYFSKSRVPEFLQQAPG